MKIQMLCAIALAAITATISLSATPTYSQSELNKVTFFCRNVKDSASNEQIPTTVAWVPERQAHIQIIGWKSQYFESAGWDAAKRCQTVTPKFQKFYDSGSLNYLITGEVKGNQVICAASNTGGQCNETNVLFTIKPQDYPDLVLARLIGIVQGTSNVPFYQSSGNQLYVPMGTLLRKAPAIDSVMSPD